jgi:hypothetical protein
MLKSGSVVSNSGHAYCKNRCRGHVAKYSGRYVKELRRGGLIGVCPPTATQISDLPYDIAQRNVIHNVVIKYTAATASSVAQESVLAVIKKLISYNLILADNSAAGNREIQEYAIASIPYDYVAANSII